MDRPFYATGLLFYRRAGTDPAFLGTCFAFRRDTHFLTAAHCVGKLTTSDIEIVLPLASARVPVSGMRYHPDADLAVLEISETGAARVQPLYGPDTISPYSWGAEFGAIGFPEDTSAEDKLEPTARYFRGFVQRFFYHQSLLGYAYTAGEMSIGAPAGLSGGPVFSMRDLGVAIGVVAENRQSSTYLRTIEEIQEEGHTYKEVVRSMIEYGIFVHLKSVEDWLDVQVPKPLP